jgi:phosphoribosylaminoimidazolecarboxamide formyltransferase/IMP cyclohydrolase
MAIEPSPFSGPDVLPVRRALLSVFDKTGLIELARALSGAGVDIVSSGGTGAALKAAGIAHRDVTAVTGFPEIMNGRVKTLHPAIHGGLLAVRDDPGHAAALREHNIAPFDLAVVNLYPFELAVAENAARARAIETIDIGGPAIIRAAAKNHAYTAIAVDPADYSAIALAVAGGGVPLSMRRELAAKAFARTAAYEAAIAGWFLADAGMATPKWTSFGGALVQALRYGENPHQSAALYRTAERRFGVTTARQVQGKELSYNNIQDIDAAYELVAEFDPARGAAVAIVKHTNPCGVAEAASGTEAHRLALRCDPVSAFGGVVAVNRPLDAETAAAIAAVFTEAVIAPDATPDAMAVLAQKQNMRVLLAGGLPDPRGKGTIVRSVAGGLLVQDRDALCADDLELRVVTKRAPTPRELADLTFAFRVAKHVKSNAIVYAKDGATVGIGAGQMSRVDAAIAGARKAAQAAIAAGLSQSLAAGSAVASDAFFPFADGLLEAAKAGATAVIQPGGSVRDAEVIAAADAAGMAMVFAGARHFRH